MAALDEFQAQLGDDGVMMGRGQQVRIVEIDGLTERAPKSQDTERDNADGAVMGPEFAAARTVILTLKIQAATAAAAQQVYDEQLAAGWNSVRTPEGGQATTPFRWRLPGQVARRLEGGRPRRLVIDPATLGTDRLIVTASYYAPDPRMLADAQRVVDLPITAPAAANTALDNDGNNPASVWWDVYGAVTGPGLIRNEAQRFDLPDVVIADGVFYRVRTDPRTVTRSSDAAYRYQDITGLPAGQTPFLEIPAGGGLFRAVGAAPGVNAKIRATYRDTWL